MFPNEFAYLNQNPVSYSVVCMEFVLYIPKIYCYISLHTIIELCSIIIHYIEILITILVWCNSF